MWWVGFSILVASTLLFAQQWQPIIHWEPVTRPTPTQQTSQIEPRLWPFYHGVASGDPLDDRVIIWTRVTPPTLDTAVAVEWVVALDTSLQQIVRRGIAYTSAYRDFTVKVDVDSLQPDRYYYYAFRAFGRWSLVGRTKTAPRDRANHLRFAVVSCSDYAAGYFNAYEHIAERNDLDAVIHLGDYIYEYAADTTQPWVRQSQRIPAPNVELLTLSDYRSRYAVYRLDPNLRRLHQQHPMIAVWDDHEVANDAYADGAENHQPSEGDYHERKRAAQRAYYEWLPVREQRHLYRSFRFGDLAELLMLDTRHEARNKQVRNVGTSATPASLDSLNDPNRTMLGGEQYEWLVTSIRQSPAQWILIGNQVMFSPIKPLPIDSSQLSAFGRLLLPTAVPLIEQRFTTDSWNNYPAEQQRLIEFFRTAAKDIVVLTGDFHSSFAFDVTASPSDQRPSVAVEALTPSVSSRNFDEILDLAAVPAFLRAEVLRTLDSTLAKNNLHLRWWDLTKHGYVLVDVRPDQVQAEWYVSDTVRIRSALLHLGKAFAVARGQRQWSQPASVPAPGKERPADPTPLDPPNVTSTVVDSPLIALALYPQPATTMLTVSFFCRQQGSISIVIRDNTGRTVEALSLQPREYGVHTIALPLAHLPSGMYILELRCGEAIEQERFVKL
ncbi:MAG: alkaline phosphatase D family protein [Bacteroidota bacterium]|nr:alkaline phosphatase D family protein [Candidatus Kapabacteria bacterium]MCS7302838.1 alkaline phosphatase D family protein [Candidatus Kapabacteria bacterium]MDW8272125.1 alkaline phosphatase D family protein [Bacteroidota bacterium]